MAQRLDRRLGKILVGDAVDLDRLAEGVAAADPRYAVQAKDVFGVGGIEQQGRIAVRWVCLRLRGGGRAERERAGNCGQQQMT